MAQRSEFEYRHLIYFIASTQNVLKPINNDFKCYVHAFVCALFLTLNVLQTVFNKYS